MEITLGQIYVTANKIFCILVFIFHQTCNIYFFKFNCIQKQQNYESTKYKFESFSCFDNYFVFVNRINYFKNFSFSFLTVVVLIFSNDYIYTTVQSYSFRSRIMLTVKRQI